MLHVVHFADLHLGMENYGHIDPTTGLSSRLMDYLRVFDALVEHALETDADAVIFAGDAFKNRDPSPTHEREFARRVRKLSQHLPVFLLVGNHDVPHAAGRAHALEIYQTLDVPNVYVARKPGLYRIETKRGPLHILALPWVVRSTFLRREEVRGLSLPEVQQLMLERLNTLTYELLEKADKNIPLVLTAHATVQGATYGSERSVMLGNELIFPPHLFRHPKIAYAALGHIHKHQQVIADPPVVYSGSMERIDFGEEKEKKGFVDVTLRKSRAGSWEGEWTFHPLPVRRFITVEVNARGEGATEQVLAALEKENIRDAVVRLIIHTDAASEPHLDDKRIRAALAPAFYVAALRRDVERPVRLRLGTNTGIESMGPLELLRQYFQTLEETQGRIDQLIEYAQGLMKDDGLG